MSEGKIETSRIQDFHRKSRFLRKNQDFDVKIGINGKIIGLAT